MPALAGRIKRLERAVCVLAGPCIVCGRTPGRWITTQPRALSFTFEPRKPAWCRRCGEPTVYVLTLEDPTEGAP